MARTRAETFDVMVVQAIEHLGPQVGERLSGVEFAVVDVPDPIEASETSDEVLEDGPVALSRIHRAGLEGMSGPVIVFYRRPIETRATRPEELSGLVHDVVVEQIARYLGETPEEIDPPAH
jgi:predicted Zn-dependent protease with MMP-like domain